MQIIAYKCPIPIELESDVQHTETETVAYTLCHIRLNEQPMNKKTQKKNPK